MSIIPNYSMILATSTTLIFSLIFLLLSRQTKQTYMIIWGVSCFIYSLMFTIDFLNFRLGLETELYILLREICALTGSNLFLYGTSSFFKRPFHVWIWGASAVFLMLIIASYGSAAIYGIMIIPIIVYCAALLFVSGCMFISYSWTQVLPEKYIASFLIILWGVFVNHFAYTMDYLPFAITTYYISILIVNVMMLVLLIVNFKKTMFLDDKRSKRFRLLVENASDQMFLYNYTTNKFEYVSPDIDSLMGVDDKTLYSSAKALATYIESPEDIRILWSIFTTPVSSAGSRTLCISKSKDDVKWAEMHYIPIKDSTGITVSIEGILRDITQQVILEKDIEETEMAKKEMLENIQHEIKTPITIIQGYTESLASHMIPEDKYDMYLNIINAKAQTLTTLVNDLTQVSEFTSQELEYSFYEYNARELFTEMSAPFILQIEQMDRQPSLSIDIDERAVIIADKNRLQQVISNLVNNSIRHTPGGKAIDISFTCDIASNVSVTENDEDMLLSIPDGSITCTISDQGDGFKDDDIEKVFARSFSTGRYLDGDYVIGTDSIKHYGIGLYIASEIIRNHSGTITAHNNSDGGATLSFTIPVYI